MLQNDVYVHVILSYTFRYNLNFVTFVCHCMCIVRAEDLHKLFVSFLSNARKTNANKIK